jgi:hypothetical protein
VNYTGSNPVLTANKFGNSEQLKTNNMKKEFIPYEQALALEELGFDELCISTIDQTGYIHIKGTEYPIRGDMWYNTIDAPLYQQAFRWFRNKYDKHCYVEAYTLPSGGKRYDYTILSNEGEEEWDDGETWKTYEQAELACLNKLIEIIKKKHGTDSSRLVF